MNSKRTPFSQIISFNKLNISKKNIELLKSHEKFRKNSINKYLLSKRNINEYNEYTFSQFKDLINLCIDKENNSPNKIQALKNISIKFNDEKKEINQSLHLQRLILKNGIISNKNYLIELNYIILDKLSSLSNFIYCLIDLIKIIGNRNNLTPLELIFLKIYLKYLMNQSDKIASIVDNNIINIFYELYNESIYDIIILVMDYLIEKLRGNNVIPPNNKYFEIEQYDRKKIQNEFLEYRKLEDMLEF